MLKMMTIVIIGGDSHCKLRECVCVVAITYTVHIVQYTLSCDLPSAALGL